MEPSSIKNKLLKTYLFLLFPVIILIAILYLLKYLNVDFGFESSKIVAIILITVAALSSVGLPIFYRTWFINKVKDMKSVSPDALIDFEKKSMFIAFITPYVLCLSIILNIAQIYITIVSFLSIYSAYYFFPSEKKITFEKKLFRTKENLESENG